MHTKRLHLKLQLDKHCRRIRRLLQSSSMARQPNSMIITKYNEMCVGLQVACQGVSGWAKVQAHNFCGAG